MAPYLNGEALPMEGALPLGMMEARRVFCDALQADGGDKLVLMSDGIVEATDADGHLFGFERVRDLLRSAITLPMWPPPHRLRPGRRHQRHLRYPHCCAGNRRSNKLTVWLCPSHRPYGQNPNLPPEIGLEADCRPYDRNV